MDQKREISDYTAEELSKLSEEELLRGIVEISDSAIKHLIKLEEFRLKAERLGNEQMAIGLGNYVDSAQSVLQVGLSRCLKMVEDDEREKPKILSLFNNLDRERGKAFVESMSSDARAYDDYLQRRRDARYDKMIQEAGEIESPANRLRH